MAAEGRAATALERRHDLELADTQVAALLVPPTRAVGAEDIRHLEHEPALRRRVLSSGLITSRSVSVATCVYSAVVSSFLCPSSTWTTRIPPSPRAGESRSSAGACASRRAVDAREGSRLVRDDVERPRRHGIEGIVAGNSQPFGSSLPSARPARHRRAAARAATAAATHSDPCGPCPARRAARCASCRCRRPERDDFADAKPRAIRHRQRGATLRLRADSIRRPTSSRLESPAVSARRQGAHLRHQLGAAEGDLEEELEPGNRRVQRDRGTPRSTQCS